MVETFTRLLNLFNFPPDKGEISLSKTLQGETRTVVESISFYWISLNKIMKREAENEFKKRKNAIAAGSSKNRICFMFAQTSIFHHTPPLRISYLPFNFPTIYFSTKSMEITAKSAMNELNSMQICAAIHSPQRKWIFLMGFLRSLDEYNRILVISDRILVYSTGMYKIVP